MSMFKFYLVVCVASLVWLTYAERSGLIFTRAVAMGAGRMLGSYQHK